MSQLVRCSIRGCKVDKSDNRPVFKCSAHDCPKMGHRLCFSRVLDNLKLQPIEIDDDVKYACTKKCYNGLKALITGTSRAVWTKDGPTGPSDSTNSESVLLDWMTTEGNFRDYRGNKQGKTKVHYCTAIAARILAEGITAVRTPKNIMDKISAIEDSFKKAHEWTLNTGEGVKETDPHGFWEYVKKLCPHYEALEPIMGDRAAVKPLASTEDLGSSSSSSSSVSGGGGDDNATTDDDDEE
jgi:hypothetical protein